MDNCFNNSNNNSSSLPPGAGRAQRGLFGKGGWAVVCAVVGLLAPLKADPPPARPYSITHYDVVVQPDLAKHLILGAVTISLTALSEGLSHIELDAADITVLGASEGKVHLRYVLADDILRIDLPRALHASQHAELRIVYRASPTRGVAFFKDQLYTAFATSHWLPCNDRPDDRATFRLVVIVPDHLQVVASGESVHESTKNGQRTSEWREDRPIPTFVFGFAAGVFRFESRRAGKTQLVLALPERAAEPEPHAQPSGGSGTEPSKSPQAEEQTSKADSDKLSSRILDETQAALGFFEENGGVRYPADRYTTVFAHGGVMQEARCFTLLPEDYLAALKKDPDDLWLLAHELAHQWWGIGMAGRDWSDFWLNEGIATFMADAFLEHQFGRARYEKEIARSRKIFEDAVASGTSRPLHFTHWSQPREAGGPIPYHKGALFLDALRSRLGDTVFWRGFQEFTRSHMGQSVTSQEFEASMEKSCHCSLSQIVSEWVYF